MLEEYFGSSSTLQRNERVKLAAMFWNIVGAGNVMFRADHLVGMGRSRQTFRSRSRPSSNPRRRDKRACLRQTLERPQLAQQIIRLRGWQLPAC